MPEVINRRAWLSLVDPQFPKTFTCTSCNCSISPALLTALESVPFLRFMLVPGVGEAGI